MSKVIVSITLVAVALAVGQVAGAMRFTLTPAVGDPVVQDSEASTVEFDNVAPGDYTASAARLDSTGAVIGSPVSAPFTVPVPAPTTVDAPATITVTLA